jgi:hypothetical protein
MKKDTEGYMSNVELETIEKNIRLLKSKIKSKDQQIPAWIQSKITRAADYTTDAAQYMNTGGPIEESSFKINPEEHKNSKPKPGTKAVRNIPTSKLSSVPNISKVTKNTPLLPKFTKESVVDKILKSLSEEDCACDENDPSEKETGSKPVRSVEKIAEKHGVSVAKIQKQLKMGIKIEKEHTNNKEEAEGIALQHLAEKPDYYSRLKKVENTQSESTIVADLLGDTQFDFISEAKKMKKDPCWDGYEMIGTKKKSGKTVPNCVKEAVLPVQNGQVMQILFSWRGKMMSSQLFFPQVRVPNRREVTDAIIKVYPDAKVLNYKLGSQNVGQPLIQVPNSHSKNYLLNNKTIGEDVDVFDEGLLDGIRDNLNKRRVDQETNKRKERIEKFKMSKVTPEKAKPEETEEPKDKPCPWRDHETLVTIRNQDKFFDKKRNSLREEGPSLSVGRGEKLPISRGGGLTQKGRDRYNRATGSNLKAPVTGDVEPGSKAAKRRKNFCSRSRSWDGERGLAARRRWKC